MFLFKKKTETSVNDVSEDNQSESAATPIIKTPASASQKQFSMFFSKENIEKEDLTLEIFKLNLLKEIEPFQKQISENR